MIYIYYKYGRLRIGTFACTPTSNHFNIYELQLSRCLRIFTEEPKRIPMPTSVVTTTKSKTTAQKTVAAIEKQKKVAIEQAQKRIQLSERYKINSRIGNKCST